MYRVMLADDSDATQKIFSLAFKDLDYELIRANDGVDALEYISHSPVDLVLADVGLPVIDGYQLCGALHKDPLTSSVPVILMGSIRFPVDHDRIQGIGCSGILEKPFETSELEALVTKLLGAERKAEVKTAFSDGLSGTPGTLADAIVNSICSETVSNPNLIPSLELKDLEARTRTLSRRHPREEEEPVRSPEKSAAGLSEEDYTQVADLVIERISGTLKTIIPEAANEVLDKKRGL